MRFKAQYRCPPAYTDILYIAIERVFAPKVKTAAARTIILCLVFTLQNDFLGLYLDNAASSQHKTELIYRPYLSTDLETPQMIPPVSLTVTEVSGDVYKITAKARMTDIGNKTFPNETYRLSKFMGLVS